MEIDFGTYVFLWILQKFWEYLFCRTPCRTADAVFRIYKLASIIRNGMVFFRMIGLTRFSSQFSFIVNRQLSAVFFIFLLQNLYLTQKQFFIRCSSWYSKKNICTFLNLERIIDKQPFVKNSKFLFFWRIVVGRYIKTNKNDSVHVFHIKVLNHTNFNFWPRTDNGPTTNFRFTPNSSITPKIYWLTPNFYKPTRPDWPTYPLSHDTRVNFQNKGIQAILHTWQVKILQFLNCGRIQKCLS